jgi:peptidyl-prolyl cis-trans isomerase SurA
MKLRCPTPLVIGILSLAAILPATSQKEPRPLPKQQTKAKTGPIRVNGFAATVNGDVITLNELIIKVAPLQSQLMAQFPRRGPNYEALLKELKSNILDELVDRTIIFTEFKDRVKDFPDHAIEAEVKRIVQNVYQGDEALFRKYLKATNLTRDQFKEQQRKELLVQNVRAQHFGDVPPPKEPELRAEYKKWAVDNRDRTKDVGTYKRIYIRKDLGDGPDAQLKLADELTKKLENGGDFAVLAKEYSNDSKAQEGGLWKDVPRTDLNSVFGSILFENKGNGVMKPIDDGSGFNIIQVIERKLGPAKSLDSVREGMKRRVISEKKKANFEKWMKKMRARAAIEKML